MSLNYHIDVQCDLCGAVYPYAARSIGAIRPHRTVAILHMRERGWSHSVQRDLCPTCRPRPRNRVHHRKDVPRQHLTLKGEACSWLTRARG